MNTKYKSPNPLDIQRGGSHYKGMAIQPVEYSYHNGIGHIESCVIKYVSRHKTKGGAEDIKKAIHYCQILLSLEYGVSDKDEVAKDGG